MSKIKIKEKGIQKQDELYDYKDFRGFKPHRFEKIIRNIPTNKSIKLLDVACGEGQFYDLLKHKRKNIDYFGIDISTKQLNLAKKKGYNVKKQDVTEKWNFKDNTFDIVFCAEILEHVFDTDFFLSEVRRVLKPNGRIILTTPNIGSLGDRMRLLIGGYPSAMEYTARIKDSGHIRAFTYKTLMKLFKENKFKSIQINGRDFYIPLITHEMKYLGKINFLLSEKLPSLSSGFVINARK